MTTWMTWGCLHWSRCRFSGARMAKHAPRGPVKAKDPLSGDHPLSVQCSAHSKQTKKQCGRKAIPGGTVCRYHGGAAPQVKAAADRRIQELEQPAIAYLAWLL